MAQRNPLVAIAREHDLAEAIVDAIREPLLVLDPDLRVIAASRPCNRRRRVSTSKMLTSVSCRWQRCRSSCTLPG